MALHPDIEPWGEDAATYVLYDEPVYCHGCGAWAVTACPYMLDVFNMSPDDPEMEYDCAECAAQCAGDI